MDDGVRVDRIRLLEQLKAAAAAAQARETAAFADSQRAASSRPGSRTSLSHVARLWEGDGRRQ